MLYAIVFINTNMSGSSREALQIAKKMGYLVILLTDRRKVMDTMNHDPYIDEVYLLPSLKVINELKKWFNDELLQKDYRIKQIISFVDGYGSIASRLADNFCDNPLNSKAIIRMENKRYTRFKLMNEPFNIKFKQIESVNDLQSVSHFPVILKRENGSSSRDIYIIKDKEQLLHCNELVSSQDTKWILEDYLEGQKFMIECLVQDEKIKFACKVEQGSHTQDHLITTYLINPFKSVSTIYMTIIEKIIKKFSLKSGHFHVEFIQNNSGIYLVEINPRISGSGMSQMIKYAYGFDYIKQIINMYLNRPVHITMNGRKQIVYTRHLTVNNEGLFIRVKGLKQIIKNRSLIDLSIKPKTGDLLKKPAHMGHRYGYIMTIGETEEDAIHNGEDIVNSLDFQIESLALT